LFELLYRELVKGVFFQRALPTSTVALTTVERNFDEMKILGKNKLPPASAVIVSNSVSPGDAVLLQNLFRRPLTFFVCTKEKIAEPKHLGVAFEKLPERTSPEIYDQLTERILAGNGAWFLPLGLPARVAHLPLLNPLVVSLSQKTGKPVIPIWFENPKTPLYNFTEEKEALTTHSPRRAEPAIMVGEAISPDKVSLCLLREKLLELGAEVFAQREDLQWSLGVACVDGLKARAGRNLITDAFLENKKLDGKTMLGLGLAVSCELKKICPEKRVGIVLPPGLAGLVINIAAVLGGKIPVNLNFTAGRAANEIAIRKAGITTVLTLPTIKERFKDFPWPQNTVDTQQLLKNLPKLRIAIHMLAGKLLPTRLISRLYGFPEKGGDTEAALLFSSGSTGEPKGIILTHKNILANVTQVREALQFGSDKKLLGCLPIFHSFGFTVTVWYPVCGGPELVTYINPLEAAKLAEIIHEHKVHLAVTTPTFLRGYLKRATREQLSSLWGIVTGAEKLPPDLAAQFEEKFSIPVREGYGLTETSPVVSVNLNDPSGGSKAFPMQSLHKRGTVGKPVPGVAVRISNPDTGQDQPSNQTGMIWLRGANIFPGYLDAPELTQEVLKDGWFKTGDLGRLDDEGFLVIEGRVSRFSKIGGEMVPHGTIESILQKCLASDSETACFAVTGRSHPEKGEELVLLTTLKLTNTTISEVLRKEGLPNLWIPKIVKIVEKIPTLASGKLDLQAIKSIASAE
jgi:acyl-[acyl-carrier-protein]-phospholipid O-acyltransferase/long-chain-fatty-acid--[acyl-carrier-protein] ligase